MASASSSCFSDTCNKTVVRNKNRFSGEVAIELTRKTSKHYQTPSSHRTQKKLQKRNGNSVHWLGVQVSAEAFCSPGIDEEKVGS